MTYTLIYFAISLLLSLGVAAILAYWRKAFKSALLAFLSILAVSWIFYFSFLDNFLTRRWGGSMIVKLPENAQMIGMTWKENSLWYQYYLPATNECVFREDAPIGIIEGEVRTPNCNPLGASK